jgi:hypothetical protein
MRDTVQLGLKKKEITFVLLPKLNSFLLSNPTADHIKGDTNQKFPATSKVCFMLPYGSTCLFLFSISY